MRALLHSPSQHFRCINHGCFAAGLSLFNHMDEPSQRLHLGQSASKCSHTGDRHACRGPGWFEWERFPAHFLPFLKATRPVHYPASLAATLVQQRHTSVIPRSGCLVPRTNSASARLCSAASAVPILRHVKYFTYGDTIGNVRAARVASAPGADVVTPAVVPDLREVASIAIMSVSKPVPPARIGALVYETTCPWATVCPMANIKMPAGFPARFGAFALLTEP